ncbi:FtsX-like permease family protein [Candidatus Parcubacteria bacterium]|nr:MAG: FtsX-like permease family protein [Candidatus Parcubacteria bacterium]
MVFNEIIKVSFKSMAANKMRTALTVLGMVVGIASIIVVFSAGEGIRSIVVGQIESFGTNIIETEIKAPTGKKGYKSESKSGAAIALGMQITTLTLDDMEEVKKLENIQDGYAAIMSQELVTFRHLRQKAFLFGTTASYEQIDSSEVAQGRFFTDREDKALAKVVVLGKKIKDELFGDSDALGKYINISNSRYQVIGIMKERGTMMQMDFDKFIYLPIRTLQKRIMGINHISYMVHQVKDMDRAAETAEEIRTILRRRHNITDPDKDDFRVVTMEEMMDILDTATSALTILLLAIVTISLIVGGVGILNVMYVIITERRSEIGLRKAVGARSWDIVMQFVLESVIITLLGGVVGILLGIVIAWLIAQVAVAHQLDWRFVLPWQSFVVAVLFSIIFGIVFGIFPARKAARLDPVETLRG